MANIVVPALQNATITWSQPAESLFGPPLRSPSASHFSTRTRLKPHTVCCRVRRKRQRLPSNASIRTDAAILFPLFHQEYCAASLPIECWSLPGLIGKTESHECAHGIVRLGPIQAQDPQGLSFNGGNAL